MSEVTPEVTPDERQPRMVTYTIHKALTDGARETSFDFVTTTAIDDEVSYWMRYESALQAALDNGTVTEAGDYLVAPIPVADAEDYERRDYNGRILTITTTPRIER